MEREKKEEEGARGGKGSKSGSVRTERAVTGCLSFAVRSGGRRRGMLLRT